MRSFWKIPVLGPLVYSVWQADARRKRDWMAPHLPRGGRLLEIGAGPGSLLDALRRDGFDATGVDIKDTSYRDDLRPVLYDGRRLPFGDDAFDAALLVTTLHHTPDPEAMIREAMRVAPRVVIIEDIYAGAMQRRLTKIADAVTNLEFFGHPHANRDDAGWTATFSRLGLAIDHASQKPIAFLFVQGLYVLDRTEERAIRPAA